MTNNPFANIVNQNFKNLFNNAIDALLEDNALTVKCKLIYNSSIIQTSLCNNCIFDSISLLSSNRYNNSGPEPFPEFSICPICLGKGTVNSKNKEEILSLAVIFDSKYFINYSSKTINIPTGSVQTLCKIDLISKIRNANEIVFDTNIQNYGNFIYQRSGDPEPCGLSDNRYIVTMWTRK